MHVHPLSLHPGHPALAADDAALRRRLAAALYAAGHALQRLALRLCSAPSRASTAAQSARLEFHAEAGAPEGALYVDGQLVAYLTGVRRL